ncbi:hypothetical protein JYG23_11815 [Sedimentibacter sp. zth1]|uniref:hypothetical protein n=1 Tax=Sedimentibacter sp. zth1 TaxID=2816908 RepID=UPI001A937BD6|nr:hypothetical protein [Sedimentibacter sp. zth1]QSX05356.1 hypothetical protein JYG23_11815 [Sedimentibacter sp. zth1]
MEIGLIIVIAGAVVNFSSDRFFKKGKIKNIKDLVKIKSLSLLVSAVGLVIAIYMNN